MLYVCNIQLYFGRVRQAMGSGGTFFAYLFANLTR